jgi:DNA-directed RNA polymerase subunit RPC12/RpoP
MLKAEPYIRQVIQNQPSMVFKCATCSRRFKQLVEFIQHQAEHGYCNKQRCQCVSCKAIFSDPCRWKNTKSFWSANV